MADPDIIEAALQGRCPRCGARSLFEAPAQIALKCSNCDLPFAELEGGGRFAGMVTAIVAIVLILIATGIDAWIAPPFWLQVIFWTPATVMIVLGSLRVFKVLPVLANYQRRYCSQDDES